jgi:hypothetical protein
MPKKRRLVSQRYVISLNQTLANRLQQKARAKGFVNVEDYIMDVLHHHAFSHSGRPRTVSFDHLAEKFAQHTKQSRKRLLMLRRMGV